MIRRHRAFTLIELLIVIAIIAIITGGTLSMLVLPLQEQAAGEFQVAIDRGLAGALPQLSEDCREARSATAEAGMLRLATPAGDIVWFLDGAALRRQRLATADAPVEPLAAPAVLPMVRAFEPAVEHHTVRVRLQAGFERWETNHQVTRTLTIPMAPVWKESNR